MWEQSSSTHWSLCVSSHHPRLIFPSDSDGHMKGDRSAARQSIFLLRKVSLCWFPQSLTLLQCGPCWVVSVQFLGLSHSSAAQNKNMWINKWFCSSIYFSNTAPTAPATALLSHNARPIMPFSFPLFRGCDTSSRSSWVWESKVCLSVCFSFSPQSVMAASSQQAAG